MKKGYSIKLNALKQVSCGVVSILLICILVSCGSKRDTIQNYSELQELINSREFLIEKQWVQPLGAGMIDLVGSPNFMRFKGGQVEIFLPYFGARHAGGAYGSDEGGILYNGPLENLEITQEENNKIEMNFEGRHKTEQLQFNIILFPNGNSETSVTSSERNRISYRGKIKELPSDN